jgi:hypothetical protein
LATRFGLASVLVLGLHPHGFCAPRDRPVAADRVGGGFTKAGLLGAYFASPDFSVSSVSSVSHPGASSTAAGSAAAGSPDFVRRDVRIDFAWTQPPGGSTGPGYRTPTAERFSARWSGQVVARFDEPYTFELASSGRARLWLHAPGTPRAAPLVETTGGAPGPVRSGPFPMKAGVAVDIELEYQPAVSTPTRPPTPTPAPTLRLSWASPRTPSELIEPIGTNGVNVSGAIGDLGNTLWADAMRGGRSTWTDPDTDAPVALDDEGWPLGDAVNICFEGAAQTRGTYALSFEGRAAVSTFPSATFVVDGVALGESLPKGKGYDPRTNTTRAELRLDVDRDILYLKFRDTERSPTPNATAGQVGTGRRPAGGAPGGAPRRGVRNVHLMRPVAVGSARASELGTLFQPGVKELFANFTTLRWILNFDKEARWQERTRPDQAKAMRGQEPVLWEDVIMLANETGRDLYICTPVNATDDYLERLARLIRFGSDAHGEPYTSEVAHPRHPGLGPGLRLYVERSNEVWNWSFSQADDNAHQAADAVARHTPEGAIVNYDGRVADDRGSDLWIRWHALQTKRTSDIFRRVFGEAEMQRRVRMLLEYQYDDFQATATDAFTFLDQYFNNGDGRHHVADPHPIPDYLWGGGAATYYGSGNPTGAQDRIVVPDGGFERAAGRSGWTFEGAAGLYPRPTLHDGFRLGAPGPLGAAPSRQPGKPAKPGAGAVALGFRVVVGPRPVAVYELGRLADPADSRDHVVRLLRERDRAVIASVMLHPSEVRAPARQIFVALGHPVTLEAGASFVVLSDEDATGDRVHGAPEVTFPDGPEAAMLRVTGPVEVADASGEPAAWVFASGQPEPGASPGARLALGPPALRFAAASAPTARPGTAADLGFPPAPAEGQQAAYVCGTGALSQSVDFGAGGSYAIQLRAAGKPDAVAPLDFFIDDRRVTSDPTGRNPAVNPLPFSGGRWAYDVRDLLVYTTTAARLAGRHQIRFVGRGTPETCAFLDEVRVASVDAIFAGGMPGRGEAGGQVAIDDYARQVSAQARHARAQGLRVVAYEGGWSVGGDFAATVVQSAAKYLDPRAAEVNDRAIRLTAEAGYALTVWGTYDLWPTSAESIANATSYPLVKSVLRSNDSLPTQAR